MGSIQTKLFIAILFLSNHCYAKFLFEPGYKYITGSYKVAQRSGDFTSREFNLNTGYLGPYFMAGISLQKGDASYDSTVTENNYTQFVQGGVGTFIGFHFYDRVRILSTYLNSTLEPKDNDDRRFFGQHIELSIGFRIIQGFILSYSQFRNQYTQYEDDITGISNGLTNNIKTSGQSIYISYLMAF